MAGEELLHGRLFEVALARCSAGVGTGNGTSTNFSRGRCAHPYLFSSYTARPVIETSLRSTPRRLLLVARLQNETIVI